MSSNGNPDNNIHSISIEQHKYLIAKWRVQSSRGVIKRAWLALDLSNCTDLLQGKPVAVPRQPEFFMHTSGVLDAGDRGDWRGKELPYGKGNDGRRWADDEDKEFIG